MQLTTKAIVISSLKYGDTGLIVKCYTVNGGLKSYLLQGVLKKKKGKIHKSQFIPLSILQLQATHNNKGNLNRIIEAKVMHPFKTLHIDLLKQSIVFFLSEFLSSILKEEEEENEMLFEFLEKAILWLDYHEDIANFHLKFLIELTKFLGFYPDTASKTHSLYFDLLAGRYVENQGVHVIQSEQLTLFNRALGIKFDKLNETLFSKYQRAIVLDTLLKYYQLHMVAFRRPKSLDVLSKVLE